jgi:hypothetical protein
MKKTNFTAELYLPYQGAVTSSYEMAKISTNNPMDHSPNHRPSTMITAS